MRVGMLSCLLALAMPREGQAAELQQIQVGIKGMVCAFCATGLRKKLGAEKGVRKVDVSLESRKVTLAVDRDASLSDARIHELVKDAGYDVVSVERSPRSNP